MFCGMCLALPADYMRENDGGSCDRPDGTSVHQINQALRERVYTTHCTGKRRSATTARMEGQGRQQASVRTMHARRHDSAHDISESSKCRTRCSRQLRRAADERVVPSWTSTKKKKTVCGQRALKTLLGVDLAGEMTGIRREGAMANAYTSRRQLSMTTTAHIRDPSSGERRTREPSLRATTLAKGDQG